MGDDNGDNGLDGGNDTDNDGVPDDRDLNTTMRATDGSQMTTINGETVYQSEDGFGNTVWINDDREVRYTSQLDGDLYDERSGVTYTRSEGEIGWETMHGTDGSVITEVVGITGLPDYQSEGGGAGTSSDGSEMGDATEGGGSLVSGVSGQTYDVGSGDATSGSVAGGTRAARANRQQPARTPVASPAKSLQNQSKDWELPGFWLFIFWVVSLSFLSGSVSTFTVLLGMTVMIQWFTVIQVIKLAAVVWFICGLAFGFPALMSRKYFWVTNAVIVEIFYIIGMLLFIASLIFA